MRTVWTFVDKEGREVYPRAWMPIMPIEIISIMFWPAIDYGDEDEMRVAVRMPESDGV